VWFYRLKIVDLDGGFKYSNVLKIRTSGTVQLSVMPNPAADYLTVNGLAGKGRVKVVDAAGKVMVEKIVQAQSLLVDIAFLHPGIYFLQYFDGSNTTIQKVFKR
jgi:Secretion system C-terminal sorting domain